MNFINLLNALPGACAQGLIWGIMAIGVYITYKVLDIADLTVDGSITTGGATCVMLMLAGFPAWAAMLSALGAGLLAGLVTGLLHTAMGIPALLSGILTQLSLYSINLRIMQKSNQSISVDKYDLLVSLRYIPQAILITAILAVVVIAVLYWFFGTSLGCSIRATGANPNMSRAQGINVDMTKIIGLMTSNGLVALSGALLSQYNGFADVKMGIGSIVIGLAAVIIGEVIFSKIFHNFALKLLSVVLGAIIYYIVLQFVFWFGLNPDYLKLLTAVVVAVFLAVPYWKRKYFTKPAVPAAKKEDKANA